jgi:5,10-methylenetetrahydromethanopterin reductase
MQRTGLVLHHGLTDGATLARQARLAEDCGYESLWVTERYFHEETFSMLGYLAAATRRLRLGVGVVNPFTRSPALTAMAAATLDRLSGGRLVLGVGRSERDVIEGRMGIPYGAPRGALEATVRTIRTLLDGERLAGGPAPFDLHAKLALRPVQARLPIYLAAIGRSALRLAGAIADGVLLNAYVPTGYVPWAIRHVHDAAREAGRDPAGIEIACMIVVREGGDPDRLHPALRARVVRLLCEPHVGQILLQTGGFDPGIATQVRSRVANGRPAEAERLVTGAMIEAFYALGPPERLAQRVEDYRRHGVTLPLLLPTLDGFEGAARALATRREVVETS